MSRVMFISKAAKHPNAAKLWLDYLLSKRGQTVLANQSELYSLRDDVASPQTAAELNKLRPGKLRPIPVSDTLLEHLDQKQRIEFFKRWKSLAK